MDHSQDLSQPRPVTAVEFCAGYAGIHLGLKRAIPNLRLIALSEIEGFPVANLVAKMEGGLLDAAPDWPDLKTFPNRAFHGQVDLLVAGFPCQPFSAAGKRGGDEDPRHLFPYIKQSLVDMRPRAVFLENVEGIISSKLKGDGWNDPEGTPVLLHVLRELERVGYRATAGVFSAAEVGAPHRRKRVFILGVADSHNSGSRENILRTELRASGSEQPPGSSRVQSRGRAGEGGEVTVWPSRPGEEQYEWEPPRVVGDDQELLRKRRNYHARSSQQGLDAFSELRDSDGDEGQSKSRCKTQSTLGGDADGPADRLDATELYLSCDNRVDELRLLGNGVVPATAERAWGVLFERLAVADNPSR